LGSFLFGRFVTFFFFKKPLIRNGKKGKMNEPEFLKVISGDTVLFGKYEITKVLSFVGGQETQHALYFSNL
tara:strand:- start:242 stop:454 length:213 start_codon:yes stop_codon:yes gene_type:complete